MSELDDDISATQIQGKFGSGMGQDERPVRDTAYQTADFLVMSGPPAEGTQAFIERLAAFLRSTAAARPDHGLKLAVSLSSDDLDAIESYFEDRADLDNEEMKLLNAVRRVKELHAKIAKDAK